MTGCSSAKHPVQHAAPYQIWISIDRESLDTNFHRRTGRFYVDAKVKNISSTDQTFTVWTNFGWSWVSDRPDIGPGIEALQNFPTKVNLKPHREYTSRIEMLSGLHLKNPATFRIGFVPDAFKPASANRQDYKNVFWSNSVTLS